MKVLVIAAHPDDEVLGCGGAIAKLSSEGHEVKILVFGEGPSARGPINRDAVKAQAQNAAKILGAELIDILGYPDNRFDEFAILDLAREIERARADFPAELILTHHAGDLNQDHRQIAAATFVSCRPINKEPPELWCYEVPSSTEWGMLTSEVFRPNLFVKIDESSWKKKIRALREYKTEVRKFPHPRSPESLDALSRTRGSQAGLERAEAFYIARKVLR